MRGGRRFFHDGEIGRNAFLGVEDSGYEDGDLDMDTWSSQRSSRDI